MKEGERKKKLSQKTTEIIPKRKKLSGFSRFFIASTVILGSVLAIGAAKSITDTPKNIKVDKHVIADKPENDKKENGENLEKFAGMKQDELDKAMLDAANNVDAKEIGLLIRAGANMDARTSMGWTPLMISSRSMMSDKAALLLISSSANLDAQNDMGMTALMIAAMNGRSTIVEALLKAGADPGLTDTRERTAYDLAVKYEWNATTGMLKNY